MSSYTNSKLAEQAGVSVHVVRDYLLRGLLHPVRRTDSGYGIFDEATLQRLCFVRAAFQAGIGLQELTQLCHALDEHTDAAADCCARLRAAITERRQTLAVIDRQLALMSAALPVTAVAPSHHA